MTRGGATDGQERMELDNHHNTLTCPHCNPKGYVLHQRHEAELAAKDAEIARLAEIAQLRDLDTADQIRKQMKLESSLIALRAEIARVAQEIRNSAGSDPDFDTNRKLKTKWANVLTVLGGSTDRG